MLTKGIQSSLPVMLKAWGRWDWDCSQRPSPTRLCIDHRGQCCLPSGGTNLLCIVDVIWLLSRLQKWGLKPKKRRTYRIKYGKDVITIDPDCHYTIPYTSHCYTISFVLRRGASVWNIILKCIWKLVTYTAVSYIQLTHILVKS